MNNMSLQASYVIGVGSYLPQNIVSNDDLVTRGIDTTDAWIKERTGITQRHIIADEDNTSDMGVRAAQKALAHAEMTAQQIDMIVVATTTPDLTFPACATIIQQKLGIERCVAFDLQAVCAGFVYALTTAEAMVATGKAQNVLVIGVDAFTRLLDWEDRSTCVLFGDGAGAFILSSKPLPAQVKAGTQGILSSYLNADGRHCNALYVDGGPSSTQTVGKVRMHGNQVFRHAVQELADAMIRVAEMAAISFEEIDWIVPHQANKRILDALGKRLSLSQEKIISTIDLHANTSAASIPLAFDVAVKDGRITHGDKVMIEAFGGGFAWGAALLSY